MARLTKEQLLGARFEFVEREVTVAGFGELLVRRLSAGRRARMMDGIAIDGDGNVTDFGEMQARMFSAMVVDPEVTVAEARELQEAWPTEEWDKVINAGQKLSGEPEEVKRTAANEFRPGADNSQVPLPTG